MNFIPGIVLGYNNWKKKGNSKQDSLERPFPPGGDKQ